LDWESLIYHFFCDAGENFENLGGPISQISLFQRRRQKFLDFREVKELDFFHFLQKSQFLGVYIYPRSSARFWPRTETRFRGPRSAKSRSRLKNCRGPRRGPDLLLL